MRRGRYSSPFRANEPGQGWRRRPQSLRGRHRLIVPRLGPTLARCLRIIDWACVSLKAIERPSTTVAAARSPADSRRAPAVSPAGNVQRARCRMGQSSRKFRARPSRRHRKSPMLLTPVHAVGTQPCHYAGPGGNDGDGNLISRSTRRHCLWRAQGNTKVLSDWDRRSLGLAPPQELRKQRDDSAGWFTPANPRLVPRRTAADTSPLRSSPPQPEPQLHHRRVTGRRRVGTTPRGTPEQAKHRPGRHRPCGEAISSQAMRSGDRGAEGRGKNLHRQRAKILARRAEHRAGRIRPTPAATVCAACTRLRARPDSNARRPCRLLACPELQLR